MLYLHIARISHSGTPTIRPLLYRRERKKKMVDSSLPPLCLIATLSRKRKRPNNNNKRAKKAHSSARYIYIGTNGLEKMLDDIRLSVFNKIFRCLIFVITEKKVNPSNFSSSINIRTTRSKNVFLLASLIHTDERKCQASIRKTTRGHHYWLPYQTIFNYCAVTTKKCLLGYISF